jgi:hypothetical protein
VFARSTPHEWRQGGREEEVRRERGEIIAHTALGFIGFNTAGRDARLRGGIARIALTLLWGSADFTQGLEIGAEAAFIAKTA